MIPMVIAGIGTANPPHRITSSDAAEIAQKYACESPAQRRLFEMMYQRAGVETRHSVVLTASDGSLDARQSFFGPAAPTTLHRMQRYEAEAGPLAVSAAHAALQDAAIAPGRVTHLITVSCTGFYAPGFDADLIRQLHLSRDVARTHVGFMGCHGAFNALRVARAFVAADPAAVPLICAVELCSLHHQYGWDSEMIVANALFADGAGAVVGVSGSTPVGADAYRLIASGSTLIDDSADTMSWRVGNHGFVMTLSPSVPDLVGLHLRPWLEAWLARHGLNLGAVASWAVHPGGPRILSAVGESLGLDPSMLHDSQRVFADFGNMSSPTILFILDRLRRTPAGRPCVALAFGPGLAVEAALLV
ncbi:MAG TPA: type III polyketide synthase [Isosphaeraceae bacterium]|jgi:predicted naringenin-chalcone synthase|nr:type III polyketide synthase [Isosphaeraceae bacterium]